MDRLIASAGLRKNSARRKLPGGHPRRGDLEVLAEQAPAPVEEQQRAEAPADLRREPGEVALGQKVSHWQYVESKSVLLTLYSVY